MKGLREEAIASAASEAIFLAAGSRGGVFRVPRGGSGEDRDVFRVNSASGRTFSKGSFQSAFRVNCKRRDVFSYYPPLGVAPPCSVSTLRSADRTENTGKYYGVVMVIGPELADAMSTTICP